MSSPVVKMCEDHPKTGPLSHLDLNEGKVLGGASFHLRPKDMVLIGCTLDPPKSEVAQLRSLEDSSI